MSIVVRVTQLMVEFKGGNEWREGHQAQRQRRHEKEKRMSRFHASH